MRGILEAYNKAYNKNRQQRNGFDVQKWIAKTGIGFHPPGYQFLGPGTHLDEQQVKKELIGWIRLQEDMILDIEILV